MYSTSKFIPKTTGSYLRPEIKPSPSNRLEEKPPYSQYPSTYSYGRNNPSRGDESRKIIGGSSTYSSTTSYETKSNKSELPLSKQASNNYTSSTTRPDSILNSERYYASQTLGLEKKNSNDLSGKSSYNTGSLTNSTMNNTNSSIRGGSSINEDFYSSSSSSSSNYNKEKKTDKGICGLRNIGNTCFMNSVLQVLFNTPIFSDYFVDKKYQKHLKDKNKGIAESFADLVTKIRIPNKTNAESTHQLKKCIERISPQFSGYDQQDSHELLRTLLLGLHDDLNTVIGKPKYRELDGNLDKQTRQQISQDYWDYYETHDKSIITDIFNGQFMSETLCNKCENISCTFDNFQDLSLSFPKQIKTLMDSNFELNKLLENFSKEEVIDDFDCKKCKTKVKAKRRLELWRIPKILVIQLKRFSFGTYRREKLSHNIIFPERLDLAPFLRNSTDPSTEKSKYYLFGIVNHSGTLYGGHYTSECMNPFDRRWYNFNDEFVSQLDYSNKFYSSRGSSSPYLLFYALE